MGIDVVGTELYNRIYSVFSKRAYIQQISYVVGLVVVGLDVVGMDEVGLIVVG